MVKPREIQRARGRKMGCGHPIMTLHEGGAAENTRRYRISPACSRHSLPSPLHTPSSYCFTALGRFQLSPTPQNCK
eukprot:Gb_11398 [translate_table: standard]